MRFTSPGLLLVALLGTTSPAHAEETVFLRVDDLGSLRGGDVEGSYALESGVNFGDPNAASFGLRHRFQVAYAFTDWIAASVEQSIKHLLDTDEVKIGVLVPEVRLNFGGLFTDSVGAWPMDLSVFFAPRIRIEGRRDPSLNFGVGTTSRDLGDWRLTANLGMEITVPAEDGSSPTNFGPRYDAAVGYLVGGGFVTSLEVWGHAAFSSRGFLEQEHHFGPSVALLIGPVRAGFNIAVGLRERNRQDLFTDYSGMLSVGFRL